MMIVENDTYVTNATLRDMFASHAITGILAAHTAGEQLPDDDEAAEWAYGYADAMLEARKVKPAPTAHPRPEQAEPGNGDGETD